MACDNKRSNDKRALDNLLKRLQGLRGSGGQNINNAVLNNPELWSLSHLLDDEYVPCYIKFCLTSLIRLQVSSQNGLFSRSIIPLTRAEVGPRYPPVTCRSACDSHNEPSGKLQPVILELGIRSLPIETLANIFELAFSTHFELGN